jgi:hypothetical protein
MTEILTKYNNFIIFHKLNVVGMCIMNSNAFLKKIDEMPAHLTSAAKHLERLGITDFLFYGGTVRDFVMGNQHNDIDVMATLPENHPFWQNFEKCLTEVPKVGAFEVRRHFTSAAFEKLFEEEGVDFLSVLRRRRTDVSFMLVKLAFTTGDNLREVIDLKIVGDTKPYLDHPKAESPINAMALTREGSLYGNVDSLEHAKRRAFVIDPDLPFAKRLKSLVRFGKINNRLGNLNLEESGPDDYLTKAWKLSNTAASIMTKVFNTAFSLRQITFRLPADPVGLAGTKPAAKPV